MTTFDRERQESGRRLPHLLPDGKGVLFIVVRHPWDLQPRVAVLELAKRQWRYLLEEAADARYVATGHVVFLRQGKLMAVPFDLDRLVLTGQPVPAIANIMQTLNTGSSHNYTGAGQLSISDSGWLVYVPGGVVPEAENSLVWVDQKGVEQPITSLKAQFVGASFSPDGRWIAYSSNESGRYEVYVRPFPGPGGKFQVSLEGGRGPR